MNTAKTATLDEMSPNGCLSRLDLASRILCGLSLAASLMTTSAYWLFHIFIADRLLERNALGLTDAFGLHGVTTFVIVCVNLLSSRWMRYEGT